MCCCSCTKQVAENEKSCEKWKGTCSRFCWHPWALAVTLRLHLQNSLGSSNVISDLYLHVWEETEVPQGLCQLRASKNWVPAAEKDQISNGCSFLYSSCFLCRATDHCTGISSIGVAAVITAYSFETCAYKTQQAVKADEQAVQKGPVWPAEVQRLGAEEWVTWQDKGFSKTCAWWALEGAGELCWKDRAGGRGSQRGQMDVKERRTAGRGWCWCCRSNRLDVFQLISLSSILKLIIKYEIACGKQDGGTDKLSNQHLGAG